jgi:alpha-N-arabinofuranosidase
LRKIDQKKTDLRYKKIHMILNRITSAVLLILLAVAAAAQTKTTLTVQIPKVLTEVQPTMWGIFFEDINFGADGGLYAELIKNRSFEFDAPLMGWKEEKSDRFSMNKESGSAMIIRRSGETTDHRFARVTVNADKSYALVNEGFYGMGIRKGVEYSFSVWAQPFDGNVKSIKS